MALFALSRASALSASSGSSRRTHRISQGFVTAFLLVFLVYFPLPFFWLFVSSTKTNTGLFTTFGLWFSPDFHFCLAG